MLAYEGLLGGHDSTLINAGGVASSILRRVIKLLRKKSALMETLQDLRRGISVSLYLNIRHL